MDSEVYGNQLQMSSLSVGHFKLLSACVSPIAYTVTRRLGTELGAGHRIVLEPEPAEKAVVETELAEPVPGPVGPARTKGGRA